MTGLVLKVHLFFDKQPVWKFYHIKTEVGQRCLDSDFKIKVSIDWKFFRTDTSDFVTSFSLLVDISVMRNIVSFFFFLNLYFSCTDVNFLDLTLLSELMKKWKKSISSIPIRCFGFSVTFFFFSKMHVTHNPLPVEMFKYWDKKKKNKGTRRDN